MSKLANLKSWLTLSDTTQFLSEKLKENVSQAELFRLAMDGHITLSIRILEPTMSNIGQAVKADKAETMMSDQVEWPSYLTIRDLPEKPYVIFTSPKLEHGLFFKKERFDFVSGIFDLRWGDGVSLALRNKYQQLTGGALFDESGLGCYLSDVKGNIYELLDLRAGKEVMTGSDKEVKANCFATGLPVDSEICARIENLNTLIDKALGHTGNLNHITDTTQRNSELTSRLDCAKDGEITNADDYPNGGYIADTSNHKIQELANKAAAQFDRSRTKIPTKKQIAKIIFDGGLVFKKYGEPASQDYIERQFSALWLKK
jgi:hypothetical protein